MTVCGEMAGDPWCAVLLAGMGIDILSVSPPSLPEVKRAIRSVSMREAAAVADKLVSLRTRGEIQAHLKAALGENPFRAA